MKNRLLQCGSFSRTIFRYGPCACRREGRVKAVPRSAGRMLRNKKYLGDDYYPAIIDKETFDRAEEIRRSRAKALGRVWELEGKKDIPFPTSFSMPAVKKVSDDPLNRRRMHTV